MIVLWPLSKKLLVEILSDRISDNFVCKLIWERLGYLPRSHGKNDFLATELTPDYWKKKFPLAPQVIATRAASVHLTRSIPKEYKQSLKKYLDFDGYSIDELFPRRTRRATAVNWLIAWKLMKKQQLPTSGPLPPLLGIPENPLMGHPEDPPIE